MPRWKRRAACSTAETPAGMHVMYPPRDVRHGRGVGAPVPPCASAERAGHALPVLLLRLDRAGQARTGGTPWPLRCKHCSIARCPLCGCKPGLWLGAPVFLGTSLTGGPKSCAAGDWGVDGSYETGGIAALQVLPYHHGDDTRQAPPPPQSLLTATRRG
jgi:hypothetical protein